ncbi:MAG: hypothetical protein QF437_06690 [Planctomycetota bacterium]|jgi:hypothetical protein|nr:hypothetical protein [Planctomycetota bacterium]MDP7130156.1 hypothetical protein [Planctomycetota bacterium]MDP7249576.1 hypothetical protein [Planctomycetota bacterium]
MSIEQLRKVWKPPLTENARTRRYQDRIDASIDGNLDQFREQSKNPVGLIHPPSNYAFCWFSSLSKWQGNEELLGLCQKGLERWADMSLADELTDIRQWDHSWTFGGIANMYATVEEALPDAVRTRFLEACHRNAPIAIHRDKMGTVGNQVISGIIGDLLYGHLLDSEEYLAIARERFEKYGPLIIMENGQANEQYGPCPNYSSGAFAGVFEYVLIEELEEWRPRILKSLDWFRWMHTESLYLIPGPSTRMYYSRWMLHLPLHCFSALEYASETQPMFLDFRDRYEPIAGDHSRDHINGTDTVSIRLNTRETSESTTEQLAKWNEPVTEYFEQTWFGRAPIKYALIRRRYQTGITYMGWLPMMGLQTWAWGDEPPILHSLHGAASGTQAWGIDTEAKSADHYYYGHGAGLMAPAVVWRPLGGSQEGQPDELPFTIWRHSKLIQMAIFTDVSTVIIHTGETGRRVTRWALNPIEPSAPIIEDGVVRFENRIGRIYSLKGTPNPEEAIGTFREEQKELPVQRLAWEIEDNDSAFAFSNESFEFVKDDLSEKRCLEFKDETGTYRADISTILDEDGYLQRNEETADVRRIL